MKKLMAAITALCLLLCMSAAAWAAAATGFGKDTQIDVTAGRVEAWDENTFLVNGENGVFTVTADGVTLTVRVKRGTPPQGARLMAIAIPQGGEAFEWLDGVLSDRGTVLLPYDIFFYKDGERLSFDGTLEISLTLPDGCGAPQVYCVSTAGTAEKLPAEQSDDAVTFQTVRGSYYVLVNGASGTDTPSSDPAKPDTPSDAPKPDGPDAPQTGDNGHMGAWAALTLLAAMGLAIVTVRKDESRA